MRAWPESLAARALSGWLSIPLDVRVRLVALVASVAVVTHVSLTGFRAPQPTPVARAAWGCVLLILMAVLIGARPIAAAWRDRRVGRSTAREGETG
jgi:hypothetical protein